MTARAPEGPKADYSAEDASESYMPRPPSAKELDKLSEQQGLITDEWTGEPPVQEHPGEDAPSDSEAGQP
jgi:hypothetical protein